ncbi:MAG TPA: hypothetical protein VK502_02090 [Candidatus Saccharimonadales bacterium]|nr:hypothetical protein [Candidatus Saccharimonadales bacterium]
MWNNLHKKLSQKDMTRREFLQFSGGLIALLFGFGNLIALITHFVKTEEPPKVAEAADASHGFGSRKFGA